MPEQKEFYIAGVKFHKLNTIINDLKVGDILDLSPEPTNKFDPNAVKIEYGFIMLGYVPKKFSSEISAIFEIGLNLECVIVELNPGAKSWEQCKCVIRVIEEEYNDTNPVFEPAGPDVGDGPDFDSGSKEEQL